MTHRVLGSLFWFTRKRDVSRLTPFARLGAYPDVPAKLTAEVIHPRIFADVR